MGTTPTNPGVFVFNPAYLDSSQTTKEMNLSTGQVITTPIPSNYCATVAGAEALQKWLVTQGITTTITQDWPFPNMWWVQESNQVPYLDDGKGAHVNPAQLIQNFQVMSYSMAAWVAGLAFTLSDTQ